MDEETRKLIATQKRLEVEIAEIDLAWFRLKMEEKRGADYENRNK